MKKLVSVLLTLCLLVSLAACGGSASSSQSGSTAQPQSGEDSTAPVERVTIRFWQAGADTANATNVMNKLVNKFMQENPDILVEYQAFPWSNDPQTAFQTAMAGDDVADLLVVGNPFDYALACRGQVLPLDEYLDDAVKEDLMGVFASDCVYQGTNADLNGKYVSMPLFGDARTIIFNKAIFDEAGVEYPDTSWSHEEFLDAARKLTGTYGGKQVYGFGTSATYCSQYLPFIWNYGGSILTEDGTAPTIDTEEWKKGIEYYLTFFEEGLTPPGSESCQLSDTLALFMDGQVAMMIATSDYAREIQNSEEFGAEKLGVGIVPHDKYQTAQAGADVMVIPSMARHPEEAGRLMNFLMQTENQLEYAKTVGFFPAVKSAAQDPYYLEDPTRRAFADAVDHGKFWIKGTFSGGVAPILKAGIQDLILGNIGSVEEYQKSMQEQVTALIAESN